MRKNVYKIRWKTSKYRKDKRTGVLNSIPRSDYIKKLFQEEEKRLKVKELK
ncbi:hypothetical protein EDD68_10788 [Melghiribacillus thermohalophilus]|uniref:Uncharacterized protein n=1 Tax=Melghiribacillus thermohalophilus TaxID=1324956 RepID=A0A4R3N3P8_9BACI|nr:hypothetical protein [Melghiribacillus thermohalophilus]TCT23374.1 hypothetical protein EDD68_10788 [Melghiribacillus thermohalophilus]